MTLINSSSYSNQAIPMFWFSDFSPDFWGVSCPVKCLFPFLCLYFIRWNVNIDQPNVFYFLKIPDFLRFFQYSQRPKTLYINLVIVTVLGLTINLHRRLKSSRPVLGTAWREARCRPVSHALVKGTVKPPLSDALVNIRWTQISGLDLTKIRAVLL